jgi:integrase
VNVCASVCGKLAQIGEIVRVSQLGRTVTEHKLTTMGKLNPKDLKALIERPGRYVDGDGLYFKTIGQGRAYWTYRFTAHGKGREMSLGPYPELTLEQARIKHKRLSADVDEGIDPVGRKHKAKTAAIASPGGGKPTFGAMADAYIGAHEASWRSGKHARQWSATLTSLPASFRDLPVDQITTEHVLAVLRPIWSVKPETASRIRARIEVILASAAVAGHIPPDRPNVAKWKNWLDLMLANPKKVGKPRGHHQALPYDQLPTLMKRLAEIDTTASRALRFTILTCARSGEVLNMTFDEVLFDDKVWRVPASRMKMSKSHDVPLSKAAVAILRAQEAQRNDRNPYVFAGVRPMRPLTHMSMSMCLRRLKIDATVHGFRSSFRDWAADIGVEFSVAEQCLAHSVGNAVTAAYLRSSMLERRRPVLADWSDFVTGETDANVVSIKRGVA